MKKSKFIFDVDGTLTPSRSKIDADFKTWFIDFCLTNDVYLVTGSDNSKTLEQLGEDLCYLPTRIYNCSGSEVWVKNQLISTKQWVAPIELVNFLNSWLVASTFCIKTGKHIEYRTSCINFSVVGRNATLGERKLYKKWDEETRERESIAFQINTTFEGITATIGGETGIDIYPSGWDKGQILSDFNMLTDKIYFFGDNTELGGNDYSLASKLTNSYKVASWKATWELLLYLKEAHIIN